MFQNKVYTLKVTLFNKINTIVMLNSQDLDLGDPQILWKLSKHFNSPYFLLFNLLH